MTSSDCVPGFRVLLSTAAMYLRGDAAVKGETFDLIDKTGCDFKRNESREEWNCWCGIAGCGVAACLSGRVGLRVERG